MQSTGYSKREHELSQGAHCCQGNTAGRVQCSPLGHSSSSRVEIYQASCLHTGQGPPLPYYKEGCDIPITDHTLDSPRLLIHADKPARTSCLTPTKPTPLTGNATRTNMHIPCQTHRFTWGIAR
eukprot:scaffold8149_cov457-Prasinococcus_capsulatus_cf.AAC.1